MKTFRNSADGNPPSIHRLKPAFLLLALLISLPAPRTAHASNTDTSGPVPILDLYRPASGDGLKVQAYRAYGSTRIPYASAVVLATFTDGGTWFATTDLLGRCDIPASEILARIEGKSGPATLLVALSLNGTVAEKRITVSENELTQYTKSAAEQSVEEGNAQARRGNIDEAIPLYRKALRLDPDSLRAAYNIGLAYEKLGKPRLAIAAYADYLLRFRAEAQDREAVKRKVIALSKDLDPLPPIPARLLTLMDEASELAVNGDLFGALKRYEFAESAAPWWAEPYYSAGYVYSHLAFQNSFNHAQNALRNLGNFLAAAPPEDPRVEAVRKKILTIKPIKEGLDVPKTVASH